MKEDSKKIDDYNVLFTKTLNVKCISHRFVDFF